MQAIAIEKYPPFLPQENYLLLPQGSNCEFCLQEINGIWQLRWGKNKLYLDFASPFYRARGGVEYLPRAFRTDKKIFDATAGFARDAWLLAYRGKEMLICERNPYLATLLLQAKSMAQGKIAEIASKIEIIYGDSREFLQANNLEDMAIYLDPMYPERKKNAAVKKPMQLLHQLLGEPNLQEQIELFQALCQSKSRKIVAKRPSFAPEILSELPPNWHFSHAITAPNTRYSVYLPR